MAIHMKRIYDKAHPRDGRRILVDRVWPRGVSKEEAQVDDWMKYLAPSRELRKWFGHDPHKWNDFKKKYFRELDANKQALSELAQEAGQNTLTLLYGAKDRDHNNAAALLDYLNKLQPPNRLRLMNTLTDKQEPFTPLSGNEVKLVTCGPSVYRAPHLGNYRTFLYEDVLHRYLEYLGCTVKRLINYTDIEDKAVGEANARNVPLEDLTAGIENRFMQEAKTLAIQLPSRIPRSSTSIDQAVRLIQQLIENGNAYRHKGDVFFDPLTFNGFGKLYGLDMSKWPKKKRRFGKDTYSGQRWNLGDFILWHGYRPQDGPVFWETALGKGRPAWNIQDPAMITKHLGYQVDICCGGIDNLYRHHDYTIAVIEALTGKPFAGYWLHGRHLLVDGKKMSKSKGNIICVEDLINKGYSPQDIRFYLLSRRYRERLNLTDNSLRSVVQKRRRLAGAVKELTLQKGYSRKSACKEPGLIDELTDGFKTNMNNDLNIPGVFDRLVNTTEELCRRKSSNMLGAADRKRIVKALESIDSVLHCLR